MEICGQVNRDQSRPKVRQESRATGRAALPGACLANWREHYGGREVGCDAATTEATLLHGGGERWQRGSNENTNRLLRQYFPRGTDLSVHSQARLNQVARELNEQPRKTLGYVSPAERFQACVASTN
jgi:hypothetical protein